jgi:tRNA threonylcarbamoyl adenosine modification protein (Sua5/YciO/YrdC/YwlC family)
MRELLYWAAPENIIELTTLLKNNQICLGSSDTVLGLLAPATIEGARALDRLKKRGSKPYIILVDTKEKLVNFVDINWSPNLIKLINHCWPGPLTLIFKLKPTVTQLFSDKQTTVALRIPEHAGLLNLLANFDGLFSTSANLAGQAVPTELAQVDSDILNKIGAIVVDQAQVQAPALVQPSLGTLSAEQSEAYRRAKNNLLASLPSTILDCSQLTNLGTGQIKVIRYGAYEVPVLEQIYGERFNS